MRTALLCALTALALLAGAAAATATPAQRDAALAGTDQWISLVLHVPIAERADVPGVKGELAPNAGFVNCLEPGVARYAPGLWRRLADPADLYFEDAWAVVEHEHWHLLGGPCVWLYGAPDPAWLFWEEGFVEAVRVDTFPAYFRAMFGTRVEWSVEPFDMYVANVAAVRAASQYATGSATWRTREARLWRRARLLEDWPHRQAAIAAAVAARGDVLVARRLDHHLLPQALECIGDCGEVFGSVGDEALCVVGRQKIHAPFLVPDRLQIHDRSLNQ